MSTQKLGKKAIAPLALTAVLLASARASANSNCVALGDQLQALQRLADSLRPDKPGLARVYAYDGTEFSAGQALWLKGQLREVEAACARRDEAAAAQRLEAVQQLIQARRRQNL